MFHNYLLLVSAWDEQDDSEEDGDDVEFGQPKQSFQKPIEHVDERQTSPEAKEERREYGQREERPYKQRGGDR